MILAKGSIVNIVGLGEGALSEDVVISLSTSFKPMFANLPEEVTQVLNAVTAGGGLLKSLTGYGLSGQTRQMSTQIWDKTEPASFNIGVDFHRVPLPGSNNKKVSAANMMETIKRFCAIPLPRERLGIGILEPPGPSYIEGLDIDRLVSFITGNDDGKTIDQKGLVDVTIGSIKFSRLLMTKAEPTFNKYVDESGYPISCRVSFNFISFYAATKNMIEAW